MKITGELLKSERINLKLSVQDVSASLKLSPKIINALEAGDLDNLPAKTFVRGFVKSYAQFLKLDVDAVLRQFQEELGTTSPLPKTPPPIPAADGDDIKAPRPSLKQTAQNYSVSSSSTLSSVFQEGDNQKKIVFMILGAIAIIVVLVISNKIVENLNSNPVATTIEPVATTQPETTTENAEPAPPASPEQTTNETPTTTKEVVHEKQDYTAITKENGFDKSNGKPIEILIEAKKDTEVFYAKGDSQSLVSLKISANQAQIIRSGSGLYLKIPEPAALKLSVNGHNKSLTGSGSKDIKLTF